MKMSPLQLRFFLCFLITTTLYALFSSLKSTSSHDSKLSAQQEKSGKLNYLSLSDLSKFLPAALVDSVVAPPIKEIQVNRKLSQHEKDELLKQDRLRGGSSSSGGIINGRVIIICLHELIVPLGLSLIKELRCLGNKRMIQVNHCHELSEQSINRIKAEVNTEVVDICTELKKQGVIKDIAWFQSYWVKPLSIIHSKYSEIMLIDADDIFMADPDVLWNVEGYKHSGTLFFYDRVIQKNENFNTDSKNKNNPNSSWLHEFLFRFDHSAFKKFKGGVGDRMKEDYFPSQMLQDSHAWKRETCHHQDSSVVLWNKSKQERATQILFHLISVTIHEHGFSHGDKESFWLACELAQSDYYFSPWGVSVVSGYQDTKIHPHTLCGSIAQYMPTRNRRAELLYINGRALVQSHPVSAKEIKISPVHNLYNENPSGVTMRRPRQVLERHEAGDECLKDVPITTLPKHFLGFLTRRRIHFIAYQLKTRFFLNMCNSNSHSRRLRN